MSESRLIMLPGPTNVPERVMNAMLKPIINHRGSEFHALYSSIEENLKSVFQTKNDIFILTASGTGGVECAVSNLVNPGDKVIVPVFGVFSERISEKIRRRMGVPIEIVVPFGYAPRASEIEEVIDREPDVKAIFIVYNETSTGVTVRDLPEIGRIAKKRDLLLIVDAVSVLGGDVLPVDEWGIDVCITASQKCLACPPGLSILSVSQEALEKAAATKGRPIYFDFLKLKESADKKETPFTPAIPLLYALDEALKLIKEEGLEKRFERHKRCAEAFYSAFEALGLSIFPKEKLSRSNTVVAVNVPRGVDEHAVTKIMWEKYNVQIAGGMGKLKGKIFRIGNMGIISKKEVLATIHAFACAINEAGYAVDLKKGLETVEAVFQG
ncbi:MAG: alanine--glyoxylate aminotransferase family protein [Candidatus Bathyarchaeia archaeon]